MLTIKEAIVVEGRYDKNVLAQLVCAVIIPVGGFSVFNDKKLQKLLIKLANERGVIIFTDSDHAGFQIRNFLKNILPKDKIKHAYIPDCYGKERRKKSPGKEGKLGVEGMPPEVIYQALEKAGASRCEHCEPKISKADLYGLGLSGCAGSEMLRTKLKKRLDFPENLSSNALLQLLCECLSLEELKKTVEEITSTSLRE